MSAHILEKNIEDCFVQWVKSDPHRFIYLGRQIRVPLGILDVLAFDRIEGSVVIFELKAHNATEKDLVQLLGYMYQVDSELRSIIIFERHINIMPLLHVRGYIVAPHVYGQKSRKLMESAPSDLGWIIWHTELDRIYFNNMSYHTPSRIHQPHHPLIYQSAELAVTKWIEMKADDAACGIPYHDDRCQHAPTSLQDRGFLPELGIIWQREQEEEV